MEFHGELIIKSENGDKAVLSDDISYNSHNEYPLIEIKSNNIEFQVDEGQNTIKETILDKSNNKNITVPFQSDLTGIIVDQIIDKKEVNLPTFDECLIYHVPLLESFINHISLVENKLAVNKND